MKLIDKQLNPRHFNTKNNLAVKLFKLNTRFDKNNNYCKVSFLTDQAVFQIFPYPGGEQNMISYQRRKSILSHIKQAAFIQWGK